MEAVHPVLNWTALTGNRRDRPDKLTGVGRAGVDASLALRNSDVRDAGQGCADGAGRQPMGLAGSGTFAATGMNVYTADRAALERSSFE